MSKQANLKKPSSRALQSVVQRKMDVGSATDRYEAEADRVADHVMRGAQATPPPMISGLFAGGVSPTQAKTKGASKKKEDKKKTPKPKVQRAAKAGGKFEKGKKDEDVEKPKTVKKASAQRDALGGTDMGEGGFTAPAATEAAIDTQRRTGGAPLSGSTQSMMQSRIGHDFSDVRVHNNSAAHKAATDLNARAFTIGNDVFFGQGQYQPSTSGGQHLIAHELTHTVQQKGGSHTVQAKRVQRNNTVPVVSANDAASNIFDGGVLGKIDFTRQSNGKAGLVTLPQFPVFVIPGTNVNKGANAGNYTAQVGNNQVQSIAPNGLNHQYMYRGAPNSRSSGTESGSGISSAYALWDRDAISQIGPTLQSNIENNIRNKNEAAQVNDPASDSIKFYYLIRGDKNASNAPSIIMGTPQMLSTARELMRPSWWNDNTGTAENAELDADHAHELQFGGRDSFANLWLLDKNTNRRFGGAANTKVENQIRALRTALLASTFWTTFSAANPTITFPASGRSGDKEVRDGWNIKYLSYVHVDPGSQKQHRSFTQNDLKMGKHVKGLKALTNEDLVTAGLRPAEGGSTNFLNLFMTQGGGKRYTMSADDAGTWNVTNRSLNVISNGFKVSSFEKTETNPGLGQQLGTLIGTPFPKQEEDRIFGPMQAITLPVMQSDPSGYLAFPDPNEVNLRQHSFSIAGLSPMFFNEHGFTPQGEYYAKGYITPTKFILPPTLRIPVIAKGDEVFISFPIPPEGLNFGPVSVTRASLDIGYAESLFVRGSADIAVENVGDGTLEATVSATGPRIAGDFNFDVDFLDPAKAEFVYDMGSDELSLTLEAGVKQGVLPGVQSGTVRATVTKDSFAMSGEINPSGFLRGAVINLVYNETEGITIELNNYRPPVDNIPAIKNAVVSVGVNKPPEGDAWTVYGNGSAEFDIPNVTGGLTLAFRDDVVTMRGQGRVEYGPAIGTLDVTATNQAMDENGAPIAGEANDSISVFGRGTASLTFGIITATAGLTYSEENGISVDGELALPPTYELFPAQVYEKELFRSPRVTFPIWGVSLAGYTLGIAGFVDAVISFDASVGPGTINDAAINAEYSFDRPEDTVITGHANLNIPAGAGFTLDVGGGLIAGVGIAEISGRLGLTGRLGLEANAGADVNLRWTPTEGLSFTAEAYANVSPKFQIGINASVTASVGIGFLSVSHTWGPWEKTLGEFGPDLQVEARMPMGWSEADGLDFDFSKATITEPEVDFEKIAKDAFLALV